MSALGTTCGRQLALSWPFLHCAAQPVLVRPHSVLWTTWGSSIQKRPENQPLQPEKQRFYSKTPLWKKEKSFWFILCDFCIERFYQRVTDKDINSCSCSLIFQEIKLDHRELLTLNEFNTFCVCVWGDYTSFWVRQDLNFCCYHISVWFMPHVMEKCIGDKVYSPSPKQDTLSPDFPRFLY